MRKVIPFYCLNMKAPYMNKANCFAILPRSGKNFYIYSDTSNEYDDWLEALCKASGTYL